MSDSISRMQDPSPADFTQTVVGSSSTSRSSLSHPASHDLIEGRFPPGTLLIGRYRIIAMLGKGGMGEVYRATDLTLGQSVALKFLPALASSDPRWLERFHSEVRIACQVSHPNVCRVYDIGEADGLPFLSMEYVDGEDLSTLLRRIGRLPSDKAIEISRKACAGLSAAHAKGVIHRDLKPHNIMLNYERRGVLSADNIGEVSAREWLAVQITVADNALFVGFLIFFTIFGLKILFWRDWIAMLAGALILSATNGNLYRSTNLLLDAGVYFAVSCGIIFGLTRFGMLTTIVAVFATNGIGRIPASTDASAWFMPLAYATLLLIAGLVVFAFWRSLGEQSLIGDSPK